VWIREEFEILAKAIDQTHFLRLFSMTDNIFSGNRIMWHANATDFVVPFFHNNNMKERKKEKREKFVL